MTTRVALLQQPVLSLALFCFVVSIQAASAQEAGSKAIERGELSQDVPRLLSEHHVPSVSIAQIKGGKLVRTGAYGEQSSDRPATSSTLYNIASLTKPISAEVVLRLVSKRAISLDEPMYKSWTDPDIAHDERRKLLTPRIALSHQTGFANWRSETGNVLTFRNDPGQTFGYSGEGYEYLAHFLENKTGHNLGEHARELVFKPARMDATAYTRQPWFETRVAVPADADGRWLKPTFASKPVASDLMYTTAADYARFLLQVMADEGITQAVAAARARVQISLRDRMCQSVPSEVCPDELGMGLGWQVLRFKNKTVLMHTGRDPGVYTFTYLCPTTGSGAVILTNGQNGNKLVIPILRSLEAESEFIDFLVSAMR
ncbi:MAG: beta-lactamase family protein [Bryobacterales bacterium]|nr:beta-lactamase family protein [Bryobacterales bacterium]